MIEKTHTAARASGADDIRPIPKLRLFTVQHDSVLAQFGADLRYRADWSSNGVRGYERTAYDHALHKMVERGLSDGRHPPIWAWQCDREAARELAFALLSEAEREHGDYVVIELNVPADAVLRSSYHGWCDLLFQCLETGVISADDAWLAWDSVDPQSGDVVQALLPGIDRSWIVETSPLEERCPASSLADTDRRYLWFFAATTLCALLLILVCFTTPLLSAFTEWPTNAAGVSWLKTLYSASYWGGIPLVIGGQTASLVLARRGWSRAAYAVPLATLGPFIITTAILFALA